MKRIGSIVALLAVAVLATSLVGCKRDSSGEGPMERAGKQVDKAAEATGDAAKNVAGDVSDAAKSATSTSDDNK